MYLISFLVACCSLSFFNSSSSFALCFLHSLIYSLSCSSNSPFLASWRAFRKFVSPLTTHFIRMSDAYPVKNKWRTTHSSLETSERRDFFLREKKHHCLKKKHDAIRTLVSYFSRCGITYKYIQSYHNKRHLLKVSRKVKATSPSRKIFFQAFCLSLRFFYKLFQIEIWNALNFFFNT